MYFPHEDTGCPIKNIRYTFLYLQELTHYNVFKVYESDKVQGCDATMFNIHSKVGLIKIAPTLLWGLLFISYQLLYFTSSNSASVTVSLAESVAPLSPPASGPGCAPPACCAL